MNRKVQHNNTAAPTQLWSEDPEYTMCCWGQGDSTPVHWWDGETSFYLAAGVNIGAWTGNFNFGPFTLGTEQYAEPDDFVSALAGTYNGSNYEMVWSEPKLVPGGVNYHMYYSSTGSMHLNGLSSGTSGGVSRGWDGSGSSAYASVHWNSSNMAETTNMWVAIRPDIPIWSVTNTNPITIQTRKPYDQHWLHTGDQVTIANLCPNANGTRTVTVIDAFTVSLGVNGTCSYSGYTGTSSGTMTATSDTANFTEILIGPSGSLQTYSACDLNQDGVVNTLDVNLAVQQALGLASCTDLTGDGVCNVVDVQRVINAMNGGTCRVGT